MKLVAGIDIGNATTETAIAVLEDNSLKFLASGITKTTGLKGTEQNINGVFTSIKQALDKCGLPFERLDLIRINEAAPVIGDVAMDTITETIITESTMIGHNPMTPGGLGLGSGFTAGIRDIKKLEKGVPYILIVPAAVDFSDAAALINEAVKEGWEIAGAVMQKDDGVLLANRLEKTIPIVDEVTHIDKVPIGMKAAIEVAAPGAVIEQLSNPYGIATLFDLDSEETKLVVPIARSLIGNRSAVVIRTPAGDVREESFPPVRSR
jgi:diol dehydratase reactivase alpha subunit